MKIFFDTEFIDDGHTIEFISIGMVREDGKELYCVTGDSNTIHRAVNHKTDEGYWLRENVVKHLPVKPRDSYWKNAQWEWDKEHPDFGCVAYKKDIAEQVRRFVTTTPNVQLWAWYAAYDHVCLAQLWGSMQKLPNGVPMMTNDLKQEHLRLGSPKLPRQSSGEHNALADARHNQVIARHMENVILGRV